jgi:hypothetical protein
MPFRLDVGRWLGVYQPSSVIDGGEEGRGRQYRNFADPAENDQVLVSTDEIIGLSGDSQGDELAVLWVA